MATEAPRTVPCSVAAGAAAGAVARPSAAIAPARARTGIQTSSSGGTARRLNPLLEPVVRVGLVVERRDLLIAGRAVKRDGLGQAAVGLEVHHAARPAGGAGFELGEQAPPEPEPPGVGRHPHALELGGRTGVELQGAAAHGLAEQAGHEHEAARGTELVVVGGDAPAGVETVREAATELGGVLPQAVAGGRVGRVADL